METVLIIIGIILYVIQFIVVLIIVAVDIIDVYDSEGCNYDPFVYYKSKRQILIDLIPGSWILKIVRVVGKWYKTLK
jgi:hypothetical protein